MPTFVVEVMPKAELLDPQGKAVAGVLARTGKGQFTDVRVGKRFEISTDAAADDATLAAIHEIARDVLSNQVIEDVVSITTLSPSIAEPAGTGKATPGAAPGAATQGDRGIA
ncbi:MAG: phosphoribosylformylglycinamidine synthase subunit PurS [Microbacteriaceae bacterium]